MKLSKVKPGFHQRAQDIRDTRIKRHLPRRTKHEEYNEREGGGEGWEEVRVCDRHQSWKGRGGL